MSERWEYAFIVPTDISLTSRNFRPGGVGFARSAGRERRFPCKARGPAARPVARPADMRPLRLSITMTMARGTTARGRIRRPTSYRANRRRCRVIRWIPRWSVPASRRAILQKGRLPRRPRRQSREAMVPEVGALYPLPPCQHCPAARNPRARARRPILPRQAIAFDLALRSVPSSPPSPLPRAEGRRCKNRPTRLPRLRR